jgi:hypothetical protein
MLSRNNRAINKANYNRMNAENHNWKQQIIKQQYHWEKLLEISL